MRVMDAKFLRLVCWDIVCQVSHAVIASLFTCFISRQNEQNTLQNFKHTLLHDNIVR